MFEILCNLVFYCLLILPEENDPQCPAYLDLRFTKTGQRRIPTTKDQKHCCSCWAISAATVFSTAVFDARVGQKERLFTFSQQYLVDCVTKEMDGCQRLPSEYALFTIKEDGLPLETFYKYVSGKTGQPQSCGVAAESALVKTKRSGHLYKAQTFGTLQGYKATMDYMTANRLPLAIRMFTPASFHDYRGDSVYDPTVEECVDAEAHPDTTMHSLTLMGFGSADESSPLRHLLCTMMTLVYDPSTEKCANAERHHDDTMNILTV